MVLIHITHCLEMRFRANLPLLNFLESPLVFFQEVNVVVVHHIVDSLLLVFQVVIRPSILLESAFHALHHTRVGVYTAFVKFPAITLLRIPQKIGIILLRFESRSLLFVHILDELLPSLQIPDSFICFLFFAS